MTTDLYNELQQAADVETRLHQVEEIGHVVDDGQVDGGTVEEGSDGLEDAGRTRPRHHLLVVVRQLLEATEESLKVHRLLLLLLLLLLASDHTTRGVNATTTTMSHHSWCQCYNNNVIPLVVSMLQQQ